MFGLEAHALIDFYTVHAHLTAEKAGEPRVFEGGAPRLASFIPWIEAHLHKWKTASYTNPDTSMHYF